MKIIENAQINLSNGEELEFIIKNDVMRPINDQFKDFFPLVVINGAQYRTKTVVAAKTNAPFLQPGTPLKINVSEMVNGKEVKRENIRRIAEPTYDYFTGYLRYVERTINGEKKLILQQKWMNDLCNFRWIDVPLFKEGE